MHKKCAHLLPSNCQITAENAITPTIAGLDQILANESNNLLMMGMGQQNVANQQQIMDNTPMDTMIPLARLPGKFPLPLPPIY